MSDTRRGDVALVALLFVLLLAWDHAGLDLPLARLAGSASGFVWRDHWLTARLLHDGGRFVAGAALLALAINLRWPWTPALPPAERTRWLLVSALGLAIVPLLKMKSTTSCPWSLAEFGGVARHVSHWAWGVADGGPGHCFPSGHTMSASAFLGGWFVLRGRQPRLARAWLAATLLLTALFGWGQALRGAHFASHVMWSAWLGWSLGWAMLGRAEPLRQPPAAARGVSLR